MIGMNPRERVERVQSIANYFNICEVIKFR
jgi:hypothetical protein